MQKTLMLVAAAAMALAGCSKEDVSDNALPGSGTKATRGFTAEIASSRTTLNDAATRMKWTAGDQLGFYTDVETDLNVASSTYAEGATNFTAEIDTKATKVYAYYPYFSSQKDRTYENVSLYIEDAQTQTEAGVLNGNMVGMYASATLAEGQNTVLTFTPIASLIAFNIYDAENNGDAVKSITFTPAGGEKLNGQHIYNLETGETTDTGYKESATVTLTTPYAVPAAKPAGKAGYIYLAVTPKSYAGGTFTVVTDKGLYTFETTKSFDLSNVYAPQVIQMNLAKVRQPAPTVNHIFYDDFSTATGTNDYFSMKVSPADYAYYYTDTYTREGSVYAFNGAIRMGVSKTTGTVTTPALKLIEGTKNLKVTFYANGWKADQALNVMASTGTVVGGSDLVMPQATDTGSGVMDKSEAALFTVYVENADATTALTFALASTTVDKRFILDDLTVDVHDGPIELTPVILADDITGVAAAGATDATFTYEVRNDNNYTASVECDGTVVTAASVENATKTVTYTVSKNADTENGRDGWVEIKLDDAAATSLKISVSQLAAFQSTGAYTVPFPLPKTTNEQIINGVTIAPYTAKGKVNGGSWTNLATGSHFNISSHFRITLPASAITSGMKVTFKTNTYGWKSDKYAAKDITKLAYMTSANPTETVFAENITGSATAAVPVDQTFTVDDKYISDSASIIILVYMAAGNCGFEDAISITVE
jgi:outer membrane lipoprotein SlyB